MLAFLLLGFALRLAASFYRANPQHPLIVSIYLYVLMNFAPGSDQFYNFVHALVPVIGFYLFVHLVDSVRLRAAAAPRPAGMESSQ